MGLIKEFRERRLYTYLGAYLVTGFVALEGVDQLISYDILPEVAYPIVLAWYLFGIVGSLIFAWYHGEKGRQETTKAEMAMHGTLGVLALATSAYIFTNTRAAEEMAAAAASSGLQANSLAVLYFDDLSPGGDLAYVADGITEALIDELSQVRSLDVVSKNGVAPYRGASLPIDSIASVLDVGSVIRGSVEQTGDRLRVTTRLVDGFSGADIERTSLDMPAGDFLAARDSVAESVSRLLRQRIGEELQLRQRQTGTTSVDAWSQLQRAERLLQTAEEAFAHGDLESALSGVDGADSLLARAELADPEWVQPPAQRAHVAFRRAYFITNGSGDYEAAGAAIPPGLEHAARALAIDESDANALEQQGSLKYLLYLLDLTPDPDEAERLLNEAQASLEAAVEADPTRATTHSILSHLYYNRSDNVSVVLAARRAYEEDAYLRDADRILVRLFWAHYDLEQLRDARIWCDEGARRFPDNYEFAECNLWVMVAPRQESSPDSAWHYQAELTRLAPETMRAYQERLGNLLVAGVLRKVGLTDSASAMFERGRGNEEIDPLQELLAYEAAVRAVTGDPEGAVAVLRRYLAANPQESFETGAGLHWWWSRLRGRDDFQALMSQGR